MLRLILNNLDMKDKKIKHSAGLLITDGQYLFVGMPSGKNRRYDIPKGQIDRGEKHFDAMIRELYEETSIVLSDAQKSQIKYLGKFSMPKLFKDVELYRLNVTSFELDSFVQNAKCLSYVPNFPVPFPEMKYFSKISFSSIKELMSKNLGPIVYSLLIK